MENTFVVNDEPMTIRITIEIIPPKKVVVVEDKKPVEVPTPPVEDPVDKEPVATPPVDSIAPPKKERKKRTSKAPVVEDEKPTETIVAPPIVEVKKDPVPTPPTKPTGTARIVKLVTFFCKGQNINPADITIALLKEKAFDIIEGYDDAIVQTAIDEFKKANIK
jgi:hypothetical protein